MYCRNFWMWNFLHKCTRDYCVDVRIDFPAFHLWDSITSSYINIAGVHFWQSTFLSATDVDTKQKLTLYSKSLASLVGLEPDEGIGQLQTHNVCKHPHAQMFLIQSDSSSFWPSASFRDEDTKRDNIWSLPQGVLPTFWTQICQKLNYCVKKENCYRGGKS